MNKILCSMSLALLLSGMALLVVAPEAVASAKQGAQTPTAKNVSPTTRTYPLIDTKDGGSDVSIVVYDGTTVKSKISTMADIAVVKGSETPTQVCEKQAFLARTTKTHRGTILTPGDEKHCVSFLAKLSKSGDMELTYTDWHNKSLSENSHDYTHLVESFTQHLQAGIPQWRLVRVAGKTQLIGTYYSQNGSPGRSISKWRHEAATVQRSLASWNPQTYRVVVNPEKTEWAGAPTILAPATFTVTVGNGDSAVVADQIAVPYTSRSSICTPGVGERILKAISTDLFTTPVNQNNCTGRPQTKKSYVRVGVVVKLTQQTGDTINTKVKQSSLHGLHTFADGGQTIELPEVSTLGQIGVFELDAMGGSQTVKMGMRNAMVIFTKEPAATPAE